MGLLVGFSEMRAAVCVVLFINSHRLMIRSGKPTEIYQDVLESLDQHVWANPMSMPNFLLV